MSQNNQLLNIHNRDHNNLTSETRCPYCVRERARLYSRRIRLTNVGPTRSRPPIRRRHRISYSTEYDTEDDLDDFLETKVWVGLSKEQIISFTRDRNVTHETDLAKKCVICSYNFKLNDELRCLPCCHGFHPNCINVWFKRTHYCPICKTDVLPEGVKGMLCTQNAQGIETI
jgi:hypothetical protein